MIRRQFLGPCTICGEETELIPTQTTGFVCKDCGAKNQSPTHVKLTDTMEVKNAD